MSGPRPKLTGQRFGKLTVHEFIYGGGGWRCTCDCGEERFLYTCQLTWGNNQSCGCDDPLERDREKHGKAGTPEYLIWTAMKKRCLNPADKDYRHYGGRGITIFQGWIDSFALFIKDVGPRPNKRMWLDRVDNSKGYEPGNVAWRTIIRQQRNRRNNRHFDFRGESLTIGDILDKYKPNGLTERSARSRLQNGWGIEKIIETPVLSK